MITLYRKDIEGRGSLFTGGNYILFMKGFRYKDDEGIIRILEYIQVHTEEGMLIFHKQKRCLDYLWLLSEEPVKMESMIDFRMRNRQIEMGSSLSSYLQDEERVYISIDGETVDSILRNPTKYDISDHLIQVNEDLKVLEDNKETPASKYAKTDKGKLTQKVYRNTEKGKENAGGRRKERLDRDKDFRAGKTWMKDHPGTSYEDYLNQLPQEELETD